MVQLPQCRLVVVKGRERGREYVVSSEVIRVGKASENDLVLPEETVSRVHLEILRDAKGYLVRDLNSTNGTQVDGAEIREAYIRAGSIITVGAVQLRFQPIEERIEVRPSEAEEFGALYGRAPAMREIFGLLERIAPTDATLLVEGEPGCGKEAVARAVHARSRRHAAPFVPVDCRALAGVTLESALFGHDKGAFPGAMAARAGAFEEAAGGTVLLDHVDELGVDAQARLVRVMAQRELKRLGSARAVKLDVRIVAATERDLRREVDKGKLREDLAFRLASVPVRLPPLRERREDIPGLVARFAAAAGRAPLGDDAVAQLAAHDWPGNVRELKSVVERGLAIPLPPPPAAATGDPTVAATPASMAIAPEFDPARSYREEKERWDGDFERAYLKWLLARSGGNISRAARDADMDRKYLHKLLKKHKILD